jgi:nephrocystin-3
MNSSEILSQDRVIRVFISSTFRDMMQERDLLVKEVFPELRRKCAKRFVTFTEVDLRWGITEAQANEGQVLPLCLAEIDRSRPYFIGLLGERYGWIPETIRPDVIIREPWLQEQLHNHTSVTEMEILHGVLNNPKMQSHAFFYFRDPTYVNNPALNEDYRRTLVEQNLKSEIERFGLDEAIRLTNQRKTKLIELKQRIRDRKLTLVESYANPKVLAKLIFNQFDSLIDELYPGEETPDKLIQERIAHEAHARNKVFACIDRPELTKILDSYVIAAEHNGKGLVFTSESGGGKTSLLASWATRWAKIHPEDFIFQHYFGATPDSATPEGFLIRLIGELNQHFKLIDEIPTDLNKLSEALPICLAKTFGKGRIILVLDALNQVLGTEPNQRLTFLPVFFPTNVAVVASALPGPALDTLRSRGWDVENLPPASDQEIKAMVDLYLSIYSRSLEPELRKQLVSSTGVNNPLFLRTLLEEIRQFGSFEQLPERIRYYLQADNPKDLFLRILPLWKDDFENKDPFEKSAKLDLVKLALTHLWAARQGLSETEWLEILGDGTNPLPRALWTPLFLNIEPHLSQLAGLFTFGHDYLRQAVESAFLPTEQSKQKSHLIIADYFENHPKQKGMNLRKASEWPYQLHAAKKMDKLLNCLTNIPLFVSLYNEQTKWELTNYWSPLRKLDIDMGDFCITALRRYKRNSVPFTKREVVSKFAEFLIDNGLYKSAEPLVFRSLWSHIFRFGWNHPKTLKIRNNWAELLSNQGKTEAAISFHKGILKSREKRLGLEHPDTLESIDNLDLLMINIDTAEAERLSRRALEVRERSLGTNHPETLKSVSNLALLLSVVNNMAYGKMDPKKKSEMEFLLKRAMEARERVLGPEHPDTLVSINNFAVSLYLESDNVRKEQLLRKVLTSSERILGPENPSTLLTAGNLADLLVHKKDYTAAEPLLRRIMEGDIKTLGLKHAYTKLSVDNLAALLEKTGRQEEAKKIRLLGGVIKPLF